jgi:hypothetical protein
MTKGIAAVPAVAGLVVALGLAPVATADMVELDALKDNTLYESKFGVDSNGAGSHFFAGGTAGAAIRRGLIAFDLAPIPAGSTITNVSLTLHMSRTIGGATDVGLHRVLNDWGEGDSDAEGEEGGGAPSAPGDATWIHTFYDGMFWDNAGGDFEAAASSTANIGSVIDFYTWMSTADLVADVQSWLDDGSTNFGWLLRNVDESVPFSAKRFDTRENIEADFRPSLTVEYATPTPSALALLLTAIPLGRSRRRGR